VQVGFENASTLRLFSSRALLERRYAVPLASRIMLRVSVLRAAPSLAAIPKDPPFSLRRTGFGRFLIDLQPPRALLMRTYGDAEADLASIKSVAILGVVGLRDAENGKTHEQSSISP
jgi:hypothetical protein